MLTLNGEIISNVSIEIGFLHRGTEKLLEVRSITKNLPYFDRFDYIAALSGEEIYSNIISNLLGSITNLRYITYICILVELNRISNHLLAITTNLMDLGAITPFLWAFELREKICCIFEIISGARMHLSIIGPESLYWQTSFNIPIEIILSTSRSIYIWTETLNDILGKLPLSRLKGIGILNLEFILKFGLSGVCGRSSGSIRDLRRDKPYGLYSFNNYIISSLQQLTGDSLSRLHVRRLEIIDSSSFINLTLINNNIYNINKKILEYSMEDTIIEFKKSTNEIINSLIYQAIESPKGELGLIIKSKDFNYLTRVGLRSPGFYNLQSFSNSLSGLLLSDIIAYLGSIDIVMGEIDR